MQLSEIVQNNETLEHLISWLKNYRGGSGLVARELACDEVAEPEGNVYFLFYCRHIP